MTHSIQIDESSPLPLHAQVADQVAWLIATGGFTEGDLLPPVRQLAEQLGINFNTVRAAYKQLETDGLVEVRRGKGTTVLGDRRGLVRRPGTRTFTIGVIVPGHTMFYIPFLDALESPDDPSLLFVCNARQNREFAGWYLDQLVAKHVDGILVISTLVRPTEVDLSDPRLPPIVFADYPDAPGPRVLFDHRLGSEIATRHMIEHGHERIGFIAATEALPNVAPKYEGYRDAMAAAGLEPGPEVVAADFSIEPGAAAAREMLELPDPPTAIVFATDNHAIGGMRTAKELGIAIPGDLALIGNDDIFLADLLQPSLSSVSVPVAEMGEQSISILRALIAGEGVVDDEIVLAPSLVARQSCGCV